MDGKEDSLKRLFLVVCLLICSGFLFSAHAETQGPLGLGIIVGDPYGITGKYWLNKTEAIDAAIGFGNLSVQADYLWHKWDLFPRPSVGQIAGYCGLGLKIKDNDHDTEFGVLGPLGIAYELPQHHIELFAELVPVLDLAPDVELNLDGGIGIRYFF